MATMEAPPRLQIRLHEGAFKNETFVEFTKDENVRKMRAAIEKVRGQLGREYDLIIGGKRSKTSDKIRSINPAKPSEVVGVHQKAGIEHVEPAVNAALQAFIHWSRTSGEERASLLFRVADVMRERKLEFMAWLVFEVSKNWFEADADISEAIDFCEFYGREALRFAKVEPPVQLPGERDTLAYIPLGVGAVISPWNFPNAIALGMTAYEIFLGAVGAEAGPDSRGRQMPNHFGQRRLHLTPPSSPTGTQCLQAVGVRALLQTGQHLGQVGSLVGRSR